MSAFDLINGDFPTLTAEQQEAVLAVVAKTRQSTNREAEVLPDGSQVYAWMGWGSTGTPDSRIHWNAGNGARGVLEPGEMLLDVYIK